MRFNDRRFDVDHVVEELGDIMWYINLMIQGLGLTWSTVLEKNIAKLEARYPDLRYDSEKSLNRNVAAEKAAMRAV